MNFWLILPFLYLGDYRAVRRPDRLRERGVTHILNVRESCRFDLEQEFRLLHRPLADDGGSSLPEAFAPCIAFINEARDSGGACLVHCHAGVNRSASIVLGYLVAEHGMTLRDAFSLVATIREGIHPHPTYFANLQDIERSVHGTVTLRVDEVLPLLADIAAKA